MRQRESLSTISMSMSTQIYIAHKR